MSAPSAEHGRTGAEVEVHLRKAGRTKIRYPARLLADDGTRVTVRAPWAGAGVRDFGFVRFEPGDVFVEHFWRDRWYAVKEVHAPDGTFKGWYCDVTRPAVREGAVVTVEDLDLDLWCSADGSTVLRLDEDEFAASSLPAADPAAARSARAALDTLEHLATTVGLRAHLGLRSWSEA
ncbi:DUF402 domain-containing protein [Streptomyces sp. p1417]|uniref:DUF402 domain-containing protein n=1 Tax=Streptomyces typhae TaxID=2681492 RepID=A0A6L6X788_9ACTN|nr:DUF402 domain-containing protein [Streptomyces typhae]MVO89601.1 DUF402 domain-containing protein [Streptomyces typhae]